MTVKQLEEMYPNNDLVIFSCPSFDDCIVGISTDNRVIYSLAKMVLWYMEKYDVDCEIALEFIEYNTLRSLPYKENSPIVLDDL